MINQVTIIGIIILALVIIMVAIDKLFVVVPFVVVPVIGALVLGYSPVEIVDLVTPNINSTLTGMILMMTFCIPFFRVLANAGMFDVAVYEIVKLTKGKPLAIYLATLIVGMVVGMSASATTIYAVTIPALLPLYEKLNLDKRILLFLCAMTNSIMNLLPWSSPTLMFASAAGADAFDVFYAHIPYSIMFFIAAVLVCVFCSLKNKNTIVENVDITHMKNPRLAEDKPMYRMKFLGINVVLFIAALVCVIAIRSIKPWFIFMVFLMVAFTVNYPKAKDARKVISEAANVIFNFALIILPVNVLIGVLQNTGMLNNFVEILTSIIPESLGKYTIVLFAILMPLIFQAIPYQIYLALMPILTAISGQYGVSPASVTALFIGTLWVSTMSSPVVAQTYLGTSLIDVEIKHFQKFSYKKQLLINTVVCVIAAVIGLCT